MRKMYIKEQLVSFGPPCVGHPMLFDDITKIEGPVYRHIEQLWDEIKCLKERIKELESKKENMDKEESNEMFPLHVIGISEECVLPEKPPTITGIEGYETFAIDSKTIGVRPKWIRVKDRLPEENVNVLVWDGNLNLDNIPYYEIASYRTFNNGSFFISGPYCLQNIVYWMPLPEPPNKI